MSSMAPHLENARILIENGIRHLELAERLQRKDERIGSACVEADEALKSLQRACDWLASAHNAAAFEQDQIRREETRPPST